VKRPAFRRKNVDWSDRKFGYAKKNRRNMTPAEKAMWEIVRKRRLGVVFNRQCPIAHYIVDFICRSHRIVLEVDGGIHETEWARAYDARRDEIIRSNGLRILRFKNREVLDSPEVVSADIKTALFANEFAGNEYEMLPSVTRTPRHSRGT